MLKVFRENIKYLSWILWLVIAAFILFLADFSSLGPGGTAPSDAAATVGRYKVTWEEFQQSYRQAEDNLRRAYGEQFNPDLARQIGLRNQILNTLINQKVLLAEAERIGIRLTDHEVQRTILKFPAFQDGEGGFVGQETYIQILRSNNLTADQFEASLRQDLLEQKVRETLTQNVFVSESDIEQAYRDRVEKAKIRFVRLPADRFADQVDATDEDLLAFFDNHQERFRVPEQRVVDYLLVNPDQIRESLEITDEEVRSYYDQRPDEFTNEEQVRASHILLRVDANRAAEEAESELTDVRQRIDKGEDFAALASELSEDPGSKGRGGDLGFFGRGDMVQEFEEAAFSAQPGDLVGPIRSDFGYHLIQVLERRPPGLQPFDGVTDRIRTQLLGDRSRALAESKASELADRMRSEKLDSPDQMLELADLDEAVSYQSTEPFGRDDNVPGIGRSTSFSVAAFDLLPAETSEPVRVARGWAVVRTREIREPRIPDLDEFRGEAEAAYRAERQIELAEERLTRALEELSTGMSFDELAKLLDLEIEETSEFGSSEPVGKLGRAPSVASVALALDEGDVGGPIVHEDSAILFEVLERRRFDRAEFERDKEQTRGSLRQQRSNQMLVSLVAQRRDEMKVSYDPQVLDYLQDSPTSSGT